jgi:hypothetical protein
VISHVLSATELATAINTGLSSIKNSVLLCVYIYIQCGKSPFFFHPAQTPPPPPAGNKIKKGNKNEATKYLGDSIGVANLGRPDIIHTFKSLCIHA